MKMESTSDGIQQHSITLLKFSGTHEYKCKQAQQRKQKAMPELTVEQKAIQPYQQSEAGFIISDTTSHYITWLATICVCNEQFVS